MSSVDWDSLQLPISEVVKTYPHDLQQDIFHYLQSLDDLNRQAYHIAFHHLGTSFSVSRSNGFLEWKKAQQASSST